MKEVFFRKPWTSLSIPCGLLALLIIAILSLTGCNSLPSTLPANEKIVLPPVVRQKTVVVSQKTVVVTAPVFAPYVEVPVNLKPAVAPYAVAADLGNITNKDMFVIYPQAKELLVKNGFVVVASNYREFFELYETERYDPVPLFITTDSILHNYHLFFDHLLRTVETEKLAPQLKELNKSVLELSKKQYDNLKGTQWENAAKRNTAFFTVASKLSDANTPMPPAVKMEAEKELNLIKEHSDITFSPIMNMGNKEPNPLKEDYTQYIARGHYEKSDSLINYFKTMMWYGRMTFRLNNEDEVKSAVLITLALDSDETRQRWEELYKTTGFFAGQSDDITCYQIRNLLKMIYGTNVNLQAVTADQEKWKAFMAAAVELKGPSVNSIPLGLDDKAPKEREKELKGFRFMGQRFTVDAHILQRLVYPEVRDNPQGEMRMLPMAMDIPAALGSQEAYTILQSAGETQYADYQEKFEKVKTEIASLDKNTWTQNLYNGWLYALMPLVQEKTPGYPSFMLNPAWSRKDINTFLGSWTELKHDTILYAKPIYAEAGGGGEYVDDRGYVEPNPYVYARLASLVKMTLKGLQAANLIDERDTENLKRMEVLSLTLKAIAEKEINNLPLTNEDYDFIRSYGASLEHFWLEALRDEGIDHRSAIYDKPSALIADVANNPSGGKTLEEATGHIYEIYAVVPVDGKLRIAKGGVYSYYEFTWPMIDRLTDTKWHEMLQTGKTPPLPEWTNMFIAPRKT